MFDDCSMPFLISADKFFMQVSATCRFCDTIFGTYYCDICRLYDNTDKKQFHCISCGICRLVFPFLRHYALLVIVVYDSIYIYIYVCVIFVVDFYLIQVVN